MKIYLATGNLNKKREMESILAGCNIVIPADEGIVFDPVEDGETFRDNSLIKARALYGIVHSPVIADDSGISVDALDGAPGIYSARYAGPNAMQGNGTKVPQCEQNRMLIKQLNDVLSSVTDAFACSYPNGVRSARYTCAMTLYLGKDRFIAVQETMEGAIVETIEDARGTGGFGYDPIFYLPDRKKTAAELTADEKNAISHRGKAARIIQAVVRSLP